MEPITAREDKILNNTINKFSVRDSDVQDMTEMGDKVRSDNIKVEGASISGRESEENPLTARVRGSPIKREGATEFSLNSATECE